MKTDLESRINEFRKSIPAEMNERFDTGHWVAAYQIVGGVSGYTVRQLRTKLDLIGDNSAVFPVQDGYSKPAENVQNGYVEFRVDHEGCYAYWQVRPEGVAIAIHQIKDGQNMAGQTLNEVAIAKTARAFLEHACNLAKGLKCSGAAIQTRMEWNGLKEKHLTLQDHNSSDPAHLDSAVGEVEVGTPDASERMADYVHGLTVKLYHAFGRHYDVDKIRALLG